MQCIITKIEYPQRLVLDCLKEIKLQHNLNEQYIKPILEKIHKKYNKPENFDKLTQVSNKVDQTKNVMQDNINQALLNIDTLDSLEKKSEDLSIQAGIFKGTAKELKNKMWWKNMKIKKRHSPNYKLLTTKLFFNLHTM